MEKEREIKLRVKQTHRQTDKDGARAREREGGRERASERERGGERERERMVYITYRGVIQFSR